MPADLITSDNLDALGFASFDADDPVGVVVQLVAAVDEGRLADIADTAYALSLAAIVTAVGLRTSRHPAPRYDTK